MAKSYTPKIVGQAKPKPVATAPVVPVVETVRIERKEANGATRRRECAAADLAHFERQGYVRVDAPAAPQAVKEDTVNA